MNAKRISGLVVALIGIVLILGALYAQGRIGQVKGEISTGTEIASEITKSPFAKKVGGVLQNRASEYDEPAKLFLYGGIIVAILGGIIFVCGGKKK